MKPKLAGCIGRKVNNATCCALLMRGAQPARKYNSIASAWVTSLGVTVHAALCTQLKTVAYIPRCIVATGKSRAQRRASRQQQSHVRKGNVADIIVARAKATLLV